MLLTNVCAALLLLTNVACADKLVEAAVGLVLYIQVSTFERIAGDMVEADLVSYPDNSSSSFRTSSADLHSKLVSGDVAPLL